ncbi:MAG: aldehyde dehydrogenase family protein, partial [Frankiales bacterium]|nr:aldehyde dehydrogenase family protein [Frankiales bacterium]
MLDRTQLYIDGAWTASSGTDTIDVLNPATEEVIGKVASGTAEDADRAVAAARAAFDSWSSLEPKVRADHLQAAADALTARTDEIGQLISEDMGMPLGFAKMIQVGLPSFNMGNFAELARSFEFDGQEVGNSLIVREA